MSGSIYFNHGKESGPWGDKITRLARAAQNHGYAVESLDYSGMNPEQRIDKLLISDARNANPLILVGSSMGAYVAAVASETLRPKGLFLMAPAFYIQEFEIQEPIPYAEHVTLVHGWEDELIPFENSVRYAGKYKATLHIVESDHRLSDKLDQIAGFFETFLVASK